ncbi:hypothetical protein EJ065_0684 [Corallococcus coralloides]|uniref:Uncharacterized protein n=1 Tax=Corallococcus coralloides TaxID=184914 RepID=A0A410RK52_CORCK|nr:hypothetical protein [Corallococcus coralloides]QAT82290.1 hypothetical protein EJ065_0684 [Corallococcus coralloides]
MDANVVAELEKAGVKVEDPMRLFIPVERDEQGQVKPVGDEVPVRFGDVTAHVRLQPISALWTGNKQPPDFNRPPFPEYEPFFFLIEVTAAGFCRDTRHAEVDQEFSQLYRHLARRPDGHHKNPLFSYLRAAARLYLSLRDVSQAEFEAVAQRLHQSAKLYSGHIGSTNYFQVVLRQVLGA